MAAIDAIRATQIAFSQRDWVGLRAAYHPDALIVTIAGGDEQLGPDEAVAALERASRDLLYNASVDQICEIDEHAAILRGVVRSRRGDGSGFQESSRIWLFTAIDSLVFRTAVFTDESAARDAHARHGIALGSCSADPG